MIEGFINYIAGVRRYSPRTQAIYREVLEGFAAWAETDVVQALTPSMLRSYEVHLLDEKNDDPNTVNLHLSVLSSFCRYLVRNDVLKSNPVRLINRPKSAKRLATFYKESSMDEYFSSTEYKADEEALEWLLSFGEAMRSDKTAIGLYKARLARLIVSILHGSGLRRSELLGLTRGSVDFRRGVLSVRGKGDKMREVPILHGLCKEILLYLQSVDAMVGPDATPDTPLLMTEKGHALYPVYVDRVIKEELGEVRSITGRKSPHVLRHTLATGLLNDGTDLYSIKELLGHSSLAATQVYTHNSIEKLKNVYNNAHPRAKKGGNHGD